MRFGRTWNDAVKSLWILAVIAFAGWAVIRRGASVWQDILLLPAWRIGAAALLVVLAKILLSFSFRVAAHCLGHPLSTVEAVSIYNTTQLAKYLPGNIWHFVGKAALLRNLGIAPTEVRNLLVLEVWWMLFGAVAFGLATLGVADPGLLHGTLVGKEVTAIAVFCVVVAALAIPLIFLGLWRRCILAHPRASLGNLAIQFGVWLCLGSSYFLLTQAYAKSSEHWIGICGAYSLAYVVGFLTPFAPGGLGIREALLTGSLLNVLPVAQAALVAGIHRLIYVVVELVMAGAIMAARRIRSLGTSSTSGR